MQKKYSQYQLRNKNYGFLNKHLKLKILKLWDCNSFQKFFKKKSYLGKPNHIKHTDQFSAKAIPQLALP